jgi:hypothetical protein
VYVCLHTGTLIHEREREREREREMLNLFVGTTVARSFVLERFFSIITGLQYPGLRGGSYDSLPHALIIRWYSHHP